MRLVDAAIPFRVVYSIYHHEYLGLLLSAHYVQLLPPSEPDTEGMLSLVHQGAHPGTLKQFAEGLEEHDAALIKELEEIRPKSLVKKFGGDPRKPLEFFTKKFEGQIEKLAISKIQKTMASVLPRLYGKAIYIMGNDGYPSPEAGKVEMPAQRATIRFKFRKKEGFIRYYPTVFAPNEKAEGGMERLVLKDSDSLILCNKPGWLVHNKVLLRFDPDIDGKKLRPFLKKEALYIPEANEEEFFKKFLIPMLEARYPIEAKGFTIHEMAPQPQFTLMVKEHNQASFSFVPQVSYDHFTFPLRDNGSVKTFMKKEDGGFNFYRINRDEKVEKKINGFLEELRPNPQSLTPWELIDKETGLSWLSNHTQDVQEMGIEILQEDNGYQLQLIRPELSLATEEDGDWFDIKAMVKIGAFEIPFIKFRNHILKGKREFNLPDGTIAILPEEWFSDYRHLLEVSEIREGGDTLSIKKYQAPLLNFPSKLGQGRRQMLEDLSSLDRIPDITPSKKLKAKLRNYQQEGLNWLHFMQQHHMGGILADDMGLGKTLQTLSLLQKTYEEKGNPSLIVLPTSLIHNWQNEAKKFTPNLSVFVHTGINRPKDPQIFSGYNLILTTYGIVRQDINMLKNYPFQFVILDESQNIKNPDSKTSKAVRKLVAEYRLSLTGTPIENTVMDIWSQMAFLNPGLLGSEAFFKKFYVSPIEKDKDPKRSAKLRRIIYPFILRRKKQQVEKDLPPRIEKLHYCEMTERQESWYQETRSQYRNYLMELINQGAWKKNKLNILTGLQKLRQIAIHPQMLDKEAYNLEESGKYLEVKRLLKQVISKKRSKVLIFSQFVKMLHLLRDDLEKEGIKFNYLDGSTKNRQEQVDTFQSDPSIQVFLISLKAGGVGLNLTAADYVFILDPWWNPAVENQAIDRSHRIGQKRTVFYYKFITEGTIEEKILNLQQRKAQLSDDIISVEEDMYKTLNAGDLEALLV